MKTTLLLVITLFAFTGLAYGQNKSSYTSTTTKACRTISSNPNEAGSYEGECPGVGGYKLRLLEGDIRQSLNVITPAKKKFELDFWGFYSGFSTVGEKVEWRTKAGVPVALIVRFNVADAEDSTKNTSYLMIAKVSKSSSCVTDVVLPGAKQNEKARALADKASSKPCKGQE
ncbi:MAG: hypothetical protein ABJA02_07570 [Acidobacteriota bacterium]